MPAANPLGCSAALAARTTRVVRAGVTVVVLLALTGSRWVWAAPEPPAPGSPAVAAPAKPAEPPAPGPAAPAPAEAAQPSEPKPPAKPKYLEGSASVDKSYEKTWNKVRSEVTKILASGKFDAGQQQLLENYYRRWVLPRMTIEENYAQLPKLRNDLAIELRRASSGPPLTTAVTLILETMTKVAKANFHPAVRYNAMLLIGDLNERESANPTIQPPVPLAAALPVMLEALTDPKQIDVVKIGALVKLERHVRLGIADSQWVTQQLIPALVALAETETPPAGRTPDGHAWMRCKAVELLGLLRTVGPENRVLKTLVRLVGDRKASLLARLAAARALGNLDFTGATGSPSEAGTALGQLALNACGAEMDATDQLITSRRNLMESLYSVLIGLGTDEQRGVRGWGREPPHKDFLDKLNERIRALLAPFDTKDIEDEELFKEVSAGVTALATFLQNAPGAAPPAEPAKPAAEPAKPAAEPAKPAAEPAKPAA